VVSWNPVISPAGLIFYDGDAFPKWRGNAFIGGMSSQSLVRIEFNGDTAREAERFDMQRRIREVEQGPDGAIWLLEDGKGPRTGWLLKLTPL
jgi:glucose/arabinose dehydrogenase